MSDIQKARDVLAKWRDREGPVAWTSTIPLVIGTAGNPDLLDAIDELFDGYDTFLIESAVPEPIRRIAAAIIAADERMSA